MTVFTTIFTIQPTFSAAYNNLAKYLNARKTAATFGEVSPGKRDLEPEDLREECCESSCDSEERFEFAEEHGHPWVGQKLCELSIK